MSAGTNATWRIPISARKAAQTDKLGARKLIREALRPVAPVGSEIVPPPTLYIVEPGCAPLLEEMADLQWNERGDDCNPADPDHLTDALLYAWRACYAWAQTPPPTQPAGRPLDREAEEMRRRDIAATERKRKRKWWQQRSSIAWSARCAGWVFVDFGRLISRSSSIVLPRPQAA